MSRDMFAWDNFIAKVRSKIPENNNHTTYKLQGWMVGNFEDSSL
jgi:hypothetical protein